jgi:hypothetical protein
MTAASGRLAHLLDLDPATQTGISELLTRLTPDETAAATRLRDQLIADLGAFLRQPLAAAVQLEAPAVQLEASAVQFEAPAAAWVAAVLAAAPDVVEWMAGRGIGEPVIAATLAEVGRQLRLHRRHTGGVGFDAPYWMFAVLSGSLYQLGRLQFDLRQFRPGEPRPPVQTGGWVLDVHIPASGPLTEAAVTDSLDRAAAFFAEHFPAQPVRVAVCASWLLDPHLGDQLASSSNMTRFQQRFTPYAEPRDDELDAVYFTFGQRGLDGLDALPRNTSLQRIVLDRLAAGERWSVVRGFLTVPGVRPGTPSSR